jgi:hypothetical protein
MLDRSRNTTISQLRREVGFGCPICRSPFLTWHHFDPPWNIEKHWRPEGMIALCPLCHADADEKGKHAGTYTKEQLRAMKNTPRSTDDVKGHFPALGNKESLLVRIGGCYAGTGSSLVSINGIPQITVNKNEAGILSLSFELRNIRDEISLQMEDNWLTAYPDNIHDMIVTPKTKEIKVWLTQDDIGLELGFKRISMEELDGILSQDRERAAANVTKHLEEECAWVPSDFQDLIRQELFSDPIGPIVKAWAQEHCKEEDGLIPLLDFEQMAIYFRGHKITIRNGIGGFLYYSAVFGNAKSAVNIQI